MTRASNKYMPKYVIQGVLQNTVDILFIKALEKINFGRE